MGRSRMLSSKNAITKYGITGLDGIKKFHINKKQMIYLPTRVARYNEVLNTSIVKHEAR